MNALCRYLGLLLPLLMIARTAVAQDVWLAVVDANGQLEPVTALVHGRWWNQLHEIKADAPEPGLPRPRFLEGTDTSRKPDGERERWLPLGKPVPSSWQGYLLDGRQQIIRTPGRLRPPQYSDDTEFVMETGLGSLQTVAPTSIWKGIAVSGAVRAHAFVEIAASRQRELLRLWDARLRDAQWAAFARVSKDWGWIGLTRKDLRTHAFTVHHFTRARYQDGTMVYFLIGHRDCHGPQQSEEAPPQECGFETSVIAREDTSGDLRVERVFVDPYCGDRVTWQPLAVIERAGTRCWLTQWHYEDGVEYGLTKPGHIFSDYPKYDCDLR